MIASAGRWSGGAVGTRAWCALAPNPGPMTLDGTNTWVLAEPGSARSVVVDLGPDEAAHLDAVCAHLTRRSLRVGQILLTHAHADHAAGAERLADRVGAPIRALDPPRRRVGSDGLGEGEVIEESGLRLQVVSTPGHTSDSLCFLLLDEGSVLTGDTVLGRGTTVVAHPDGRLEDYLSSLRRLRDLATAGAVVRLLPGHGPPLPDALGVIEFYLSHRAERLEQVSAAVSAGARSPRAVVETVYADVDRTLWPAAERSVRAQLEYLGARPAGR